MMHLRMAVEAQGDCIADIRAVLGRSGLDVIDFDLDTAVSVADATAPMAPDEKGIDISLPEFVSGHLIDTSCGRMAPTSCSRARVASSPRPRGALAAQTQVGLSSTSKSADAHQLTPMFVFLRRRRSEASRNDPANQCPHQA